MSIIVQSVSQQQLGLQTGDGDKSQLHNPTVVGALTCDTPEPGENGTTDPGMEGDDVTVPGNGSEVEDGDTLFVCPLD
jgi:hypothetical protein